MIGDLLSITTNSCKLSRTRVFRAGNCERVGAIVIGLTVNK